MHEYLKRLIGEKKDLQKKRDNINFIIERSLGKKDYFIRKHKYFWRIRDINTRIKEINKKNRICNKSERYYGEKK